MASGPDNYNHNKLKKTIGGNTITSATWFDVIEEIDVATVKSKKMHENCDEHCKIRIIAVAEILHFGKGSTHCYDEDKRGKWSVGFVNEDEESSRLASPTFTPDAIYISGTGSYPSFAHYDGEWWVIFGILKRKINGETVKCYVLHNPKGTFDKRYLDSLKDRFFPDILAKEVEKWE